MPCTVYKQGQGYVKVGQLSLFNPQGVSPEDIILASMGPIEKFTIRMSLSDPKLGGYCGR